MLSQCQYSCYLQPFRDTTYHSVSQILFFAQKWPSVSQPILFSSFFGLIERTSVYVFVHIFDQVQSTHKTNILLIFNLFNRLQIGPKVAILHKNIFFLFNQKYEAACSSCCNFYSFQKHVFDNMHSLACLYEYRHYSYSAIVHRLT